MTWCSTKEVVTEQSTHRVATDAPTSLVRFRARVVAGADAGTETASLDGRLVIGTAEGNMLRLTDPSVSKYHVELEASASGLVIRDIGSTNGTLAYGQMVREIVALQPLDLVLGHTRVQISFDDERLPRSVSTATRFGDLVGTSQGMRAVFAVMEKAAPTNAPVLLTGESGTGKELAAHAIHAHSARAHGRFEVVDCAALSPTLIESELFGHARGAFTGAVTDRPGAFERANGGTLFLDELGELPIELQPKLLRVLSAREVRRVGGDAARGVDVRIIAATNRDLRRDVNLGTFRSDLYYRLAVVPIHMPALRERSDDIPLLVAELLNSLAPGVRVPELDVYQLLTHAWPGNVRELRNFLEHLLVLKSAPTLGEGSEPPPAFPLPLHVAATRFERHYLKQLLATADGNVAEAARQAGVNRATMFRLINRHKLRESS